MRPAWIRPIAERRALALSALALVCLVVGWSATRAAPANGHAIGLWPVGLATVGLIGVPRRLLAPAAVVLAAIAATSIAAGGRPVGVAVGYGLGVAADCVVVALLLTGAGRRSWRLRTDEDLARYLLAALAGGLVGGSAGALTSLVTGFGTPGIVALALGSSQLASQLVLPPLFADLPEHGAIAGPVERGLQWAFVLVVTPLVFLPRDLPSLTFLAIPVLAWGALRIRPREALAQLLAVLAFAVVTTSSDLGPFAAAPRDLGLAVDVRGILLAAYAASCSLLVIPLLIRVGQHIEARRHAASERDTLDRIVRSTHGVAIIGTGPDGRITLFNPGAERLLGYTAAEVLGQRTEPLHPASEVGRLAEQLGVAADFSVVAARLMHPDMAGTEIDFVRRDGEVRTHSMTLSRVVDDRGLVVGHLSTSEDITERVRTQQALEEALERMREVDAVKDAFVSSVSHELRTPITSILGYLEMLTDGSFGPMLPDQEKAVGRIAGNSRRLLSLIDDLLVLSRLQGMGDLLAEPPPEVAPVEVGGPVATGCAVVAPAAQHAGIDLAVDLPAEAARVRVPPDLVERVVINLVGNAVKFTPSGGRVRVRVAPAPSEDGVPGVRLEVEDTGIGIPADEVGLLFTRFFRSSLAQRQAIPGSGLGLSIIQGVLDRSGGRISVRSQVGEGSVFSVWWPAA